ncbi:E3 ubiquitin-protein ligase ICP0 [Acrasis kona]|uniref:E3 ubiquitin-protein ligase ICP0 n=1 Tax=Acrasis kona TaxID=1008807 RepID=A0AAW2ZPH7_9EUKA
MPRLVSNANRIAIQNNNDKENIAPSSTTTQKYSKLKIVKLNGTEKKTITVQPAASCVICCDTITQRAKINSCLHVFCLECIKHWSTQSSTCPVCRERFTKIESNGNIPISVVRKDYRHEHDEDDVYGVIERLIDEEEDEEEEEDEDVDENGNLEGFIDYDPQNISPARNRLRFRSVFESNDDDFSLSQQEDDGEDDEEEEMVCTQEQHSIISVQSSPSPIKKKRKRIVLEDEDYESDSTVILDQEHIYNTVVKRMLF